MKTLIVVDMQNDFIDGALGTKEAQAIVKNVAAKIREYQAEGNEIIFTRDTHGEDYLDTPEGKKLPVKHCIKGTKGWEIADGLYDHPEIKYEEFFAYKTYTDYLKRQGMTVTEHAADIATAFVASYKQGEIRLYGCPAEGRRIWKH